MCPIDSRPGKGNLLASRMGVQRRPSGGARSEWAEPTGGKVRAPSAGPPHLGRLILLLLLVLTFALPALADEAPKDELIVGISGLVDAPWTGEDDNFTYGSLEYRFALPWERFSIGTSFEFRGGVRYVNASLYFKVYESKRFVVGIESGPGYLNTGREILGNSLEFRSMVELQFKLTDRQRVGIDYCHYSNASTGSINPGSESLRFFWAIRL
jgi:hypothetical protein